jgi:hypothetical protein
MQYFPRPSLDFQSIVKIVKIIMKIDLSIILPAFLSVCQTMNKFFRKGQITLKLDICELFDIYLENLSFIEQ